jgi:hypothetical protein
MYYKLPSSERGKPRNGSSLFSLHVARERGLSCPGTMPPAGLQPRGEPTHGTHSHCILEPHRSTGCSWRAWAPPCSPTLVSVGLQRRGKMQKRASSTPSAGVASPQRRHWPKSHAAPSCGWRPRAWASWGAAWRMRWSVIALCTSTLSPNRADTLRFTRRISLALSPDTARSMPVSQQRWRSQCHSHQFRYQGRCRVHDPGPAQKDHRGVPA